MQYMARKKSDMDKIVETVDKQFKEWDENSKSGSAEKIKTKPYFCPFCGSPVDEIVDKEKGECKDEKDFDEMREQMKFIEAFEETIREMNERNEKMEKHLPEKLPKRKKMPKKKTTKIKIPVDILRRPRRTTIPIPVRPKTLPKKDAEAIWIADSDPYRFYRLKNMIENNGQKRKNLKEVGWSF